MPEDAPRPAQAAIRTDLGAIFVSLELSRRAWLITSLSPGSGGENVQALGSGGRGVWAAASVCRAQAQGCGADRPGIPDYRHPGGRFGRLLDPPGAAVRRDREPRGRRRLDPDLAPASAGEDRPDRSRYDPTETSVPTRSADERDTRQHVCQSRAVHSRSRAQSTKVHAIWRARSPRPRPTRPRTASAKRSRCYSPTSSAS